MLTRREMNGSLALALTNIVLATVGEQLRASAAPVQAMPRRKPARHSIGVQTLMKEALAPMPDAEVSMMTLTIAPGSNSAPHRHIGPVFAYVLEGKIENQVDPNPPQVYKAGQYFYEPPMHVHRSLRNLNRNEPARVLIFEVGEKGKQFTIVAK
jgi:quercetin dioxygenase-like cupin family protein